jgi:Lar family restriction alleviation protein
MSELKRCPFCNGFVTENEIDFGEWSNMWSISCNDCHASTGNHFKKQDAIKAWNQRPYDYDMPAIVRRVQQLETQVTALLVLLDGFRNADPYMEFSQAWQDADKAGLLGFLTSCKQPE